MRRASLTLLRCGSSPATRSVPEVGIRIPVSILIVVDLPAPFGPMYPTSSPGSTRRSMPSTAVKLVRCRWKRPELRYRVKVLVSCSARMIGSATSDLLPVERVARRRRIMPKPAEGAQRIIPPAARTKVANVTSMHEEVRAS